MIRAALIWLALACPAAATQDRWPALFDVAGVDESDVLNIRAAPSADAEIVGSLRHDARDIEVVRPNDRETWGLINTGEGTGWVSLAFLARQPGQWLGSEIEAASCGGTEPFWGLKINGPAVTWSVPGGDAVEEVSGRVVERLSADARRDVQGLMFELATGAEGVGILTLEACGDGMSDRAYGIRLDLVTGLGKTPALYSGCCSLR